MSDNVIRPAAWIGNGQQSLERPEPERRQPQVLVFGGGSGPDDPGINGRVTALEADMKDVKAGIGRLEVSAAEIQATLTGVSTKADSATAIARIDALDGRTRALEAAVSDTVKSAVAKSIGPWQLPAVLGACGGIIVLIVAALGWLARQPWFAPHP